MTTYDGKAIKYMLDNAMDFTDKMSDWERSFIESVSEQFDKGHSLSQKQVDVLERIHEKLP